jgi:hypothetical protein
VQQSVAGLTLEAPDVELKFKIEADKTQICKRLQMELNMGLE